MYLSNFLPHVNFVHRVTIDFSSYATIFLTLTLDNFNVQYAKRLNRIKLNSIRQLIQGFKKRERSFHCLSHAHDKCLAHFFLFLVIGNIFWKRDFLQTATDKNNNDKNNQLSTSTNAWLQPNGRKRYWLFTHLANPHKEALSCWFEKHWEGV